MTTKKCIRAWLAALMIVPIAGCAASTDGQQDARPASASVNARPPALARGASPHPVIAQDMTIRPSVATPGASVRAHFPIDNARGVAFTLQRRIPSGSWRVVDQLIRVWDSNASGARPLPAEANGSDAWRAIEISGAGPDLLTLPTGIPGGAYRICTAQTPQSLCGTLTVTDGLAP